VAETLPTLAEALDDEAAAIDGLERRATGDRGVEWAVGDVVFAALTGRRAEFGLSPAVAAAALRTPDTAPSARGAGWVAFEPVEVDGYALDRAIAWLGSAARRVATDH
jgi:hypothetical protein